MKRHFLHLTLAFLAFSTLSTLATVRYVDVNGTSPTPPYTNWATAATNIQDAVNAAVNGDEILATNGVYATGGRIVSGVSTTNRVAVTKPLTVRSVNGPEFTVIRGDPASGTNFSASIRCVYLNDGASLSGFTLTNGAAASGGGVLCTSTNAVITNCMLSGNSATNGGGACYGTLNNCTLKDNDAYGNGGGAIGSMLNNCMLTGNSALRSGGGASDGKLNNCTLENNTANWNGGGALGSLLNNCTLTGDSALRSGGGAYKCTLNNCTLTGNSALWSGGGAADSTLKNCIVYFNTAVEDGANYFMTEFLPGSFIGSLDFCCTTPLPNVGTGNLSLDPQLASASHLSAGSPCRGAGSVTYAGGTDIDGDAWASPPSIGCDEYWAGSVTGPLSASVRASFTNIAVGFPLRMTAEIEGRTSASVWDFGDGTVVSNQPYASHAWASPGDYVVTLTAFNESEPGGIDTPLTIHVIEQPVHYVAIESGAPQAPYTNWATAARTIQEAVDAATAVGALVLVNDGIYAVGSRTVYGTMANRVVVNKPLTVRSVNGPQFAVIQGYQVPGTTNGNGAIRCVYLGTGASLSGFTLTNGATRGYWGADRSREQSGGGVWCEWADAVITNCLLSGNSAYYGGGAYSGTLHNCSLTGNWARVYGGGACYSTLTNCTLTGNFAALEGGGANSGTLDDCTLTDNSAGSGGGACHGTLNHCTLTGNSAYVGGGASSNTLNHCTLTGNSASRDGGGAHYSRLNHCALTGNSARSSGGGACLSRLNNCALTDNSALISGGGASGGTLNNCLLKGNFALSTGGGTFGGTLSNCTLTVNSARSGGGASGGTLKNCIVYFNTAVENGPNYTSTYLNATYYTIALDYCCTIPLPTNGTGNISADPQLASASHLSAGSPCRGAGKAAYARGTDIDGEAWASLPSIGCDEYRTGAVTGPLSVSVRAPFTNVIVGLPLTFVAEIGGRTSASVWDFGDGTVVSNQPSVRHVWANPGDYELVLTAFNESLPDGVSATLTIRVLEQQVYYVAVGSSAPQAPYTNWATAARTIQEAVDTATVAGALVLVNDGLYAVGGRAVHETMSNRVVLNKPLTVQSVNGPQFTVIEGRQVPGTTNGDGAIRCVYLASHACLSGFTLTNGATRRQLDNGHDDSGGGVWCESADSVITNCALTGNAAYRRGGGAYYGTLNNCILTANSANNGGGAYFCTLNNCTLTANSAFAGGGVYSGTLNNCIVYFNTATTGTNYYPNPYEVLSLSYCCTTPMWSTSPGNITNAPRFVDQAGGNLRLQSNSPCINAGNNVSAPSGPDLDGNPRIAGGTVDIGAYEFQSPASVLSYAWAQQFGLPTDGSADFADTDGDRLNNWQEWRASTVPTSAASVLKMLSATATVAPPGLSVRWQSVSGVAYDLQRSTNLSAPPAFQTFATNLVGLAGATSYTDTNAIGSGPFFYRAAVR